MSSSLADAVVARSSAELPAELLQAVLDQLGEGVVVADELGEIVVFNPAASEIVGAHLVPPSPLHWSRAYGIFLADGETLCPA